MSNADLVGWDRLRHGGLLLDTPRLRRVAEHVPGPLPSHEERELRRLAASVLDGGASVPEFVTFVLERVCGFTASTGSWQRGSQVGAEWGRRAVTGEMTKPRQLWRGPDGAVLPVFLDAETRLGIGRGRRATSQAVQWLRSGSERLALLTNGRQWRLLFAGLDFDAWCEWDVDLWFEEGALSPQVLVLRTLIQPELLTPPAKDAPSPLLAAILDSRKGQADLSAELGERVREAVELLVQAHGEVLKEQCAGVDPAEIYRAAVRVVMRMVVVLFAESRELLPRDNTLYHGAYGLTGLLEGLEKAAARGGNRLARSFSAWPRVLALFRLVHQGSHHPALPVPAYGGELFAPGDMAANDGLTHALAVFERAAFDREILPDRDLHRMLERITRTRVKVRQGRASTWVPAPVDFSDLSSEYIGILYEGLLDFELRTAPPGDPVVFLAVGNQPALPLSRLEAMDDKALASLLEKLKDTSRADDEGAEEQGEETESRDEEETESEETEEDADAGPADDAERSTDDERHVTRTRAENWARRAVEVGKLARKPRGALTPEKRLVYGETVARKARQLVVRVILPGEWYVVRWGGTRKGAGTFYTRPGLAVPTVQRTLRPLAYTPPAAPEGKPDRDAPPAAWTPRPPEEILALKVCDPACGSGTFPVAALRFLTEALWSSLHHHGRISAEGGRALVRLLAGAPTGSGGAEERLGQEMLPCRPDDPLFEPRLKAILRRHVVERCIYGVDLDPLAVELCRLSLWIETMDRTLPFSFLDHKVKCGNSLVGAWFDQFQHYPVMAWKNREGGDKGHTNGVHFQKEARTKAIKAFVKDRLTPDLRYFLEGRTLFSEDMQKQAAGVHAGALATLSRLHDLSVTDSAERARIYREELLDTPAYRSLKAAMDLWCACWFWPAADLGDAPLPTSFAAPPPLTRAIAERIASRKRFFHWELEFPDVFRAAGSGFDAVLGNPPWENLQPNPEEFFSNVDPLFRTYGRVVKQARQRDLFARDAAFETEWLDYSGDFNNFSHWVCCAASPFGDPQLSAEGNSSFVMGRGSGDLHAFWRSQRRRARSYATAGHPFRHQVGRLFTYKLFLEQCHALLRDGGRLGQIVPSGIYSDAWSQPLRELFLDQCRWEWLFCFENRNRVFPIHRSFKFAPIIVQRGGITEQTLTAFMRGEIEDWELGEVFATPYARAQVSRFSPRSKAILEIQSRRDIEILDRIYANSLLLDDDGPDAWAIEHRLEYMMNTDAHLFPPRPKWEADGYRPDEYSRWVKGDWRPIAELWARLGVKPLPAGERRCAQPPYDTVPVPRADIPGGVLLSRDTDAWLQEDRVDDLALPLYQGTMVQAFMPSARGWLSGTGLSAAWDYNSPARLVWNPQYLVGQGTAAERVPQLHSCKVGYREVARSTDPRSFIGAVLPQFPCGHKVPTLTMAGAVEVTLAAAGMMNSFAFDWLVRMRLGAAALAWYVLRESSLPHRKVARRMAGMVERLNLISPVFAPLALRLQSALPVLALTPSERLRVRVISDVVAATAFALTLEDMQTILADCSLPCSRLCGPAVMRKALDPRGFWRVDRDQEPELRLTVLTLVAFHDLEEKIRGCGGDREKGIEAFLGQNDGEGWMLPETLRLADYGLGHDERARHPQPVASRLGPRFYDWQLAQSPEESRRECHLHARNLLGEAGYRQLLADVQAGRTGGQPAVVKTTPRGDRVGLQGMLYDEPEGSRP